MNTAHPSEQRLRDLRNLRESLGMTQQELATRVGVSESTIRNFENGRRVPREYGKIVAVLRAARVEELGIYSAGRLAEVTPGDEAMAQRILDAVPIGDVIGDAIDVALDVEEVRIREQMRRTLDERGGGAQRDEQAG